MSFQMQARSSADGQVYHWIAASADFAASGYGGPGSALDVAVSMRPASGTGGGVTAHSLLTGLTTGDDHTQYDLARRPLSAYAATSNSVALADARKFITTSNASANTLTIVKQATIVWLTESLLGGCNIGAGTMTLTPDAGVTLNAISLVVPSKAWWSAKRRSSDVWDVVVYGISASAGDFKADGTVPMTADLNHGGHKGTNAADGSSATDLTTLQQVQALIAAGISTVFDIKQSARLATAAAMAASTRVSNVRTANANGAMATIDGIAPAVSDRILDKNNATGADRGLWVVTSLGSGGTPWVLTRAADSDTSAEVTPGFAVIVEEGAANTGHCFILTTPAPFTVNASAWAFADISQVTGDGTTIQLVAGVLSLVAGGVATTHLGNDVVTFAKLLNATGADKIVGSTAAGDFQELGLAGGVERNGTNLQVSTQLPARGSENVIVDLYPRGQGTGTIATGTTINFDTPIATGKRYELTFNVWCDDGAGGAMKFAKALKVVAHQTGGNAVIAVGPITIHDSASSGWTLSVADNTTNMRFSLNNATGSTASYNYAFGGFELDKP